ncbi:MAG: aldehyde dehydrogenase family protein, partial [Candidatus Aminicenantales bacterium]
MNRPPRTRHPLRWIRRLQAFFTIGLGLVLVAIAGYFLTHLKRPGGLESRDGGFTPQKIEVQESAIHFEFDNGRSRMDFKIHKCYLGSDGLYHYEGGVEVVDHGKKGGREIRINADQAVSDKDQTAFRFMGHVSVFSKGLTVRGDSFAYDKSRDLVFNETGVTMHSERVQHRMYEQWHPLGVVGVISAFNFPVAVWSWNAFLAAIAGNSVVWKPSAKTSL